MRFALAAVMTVIPALAGDRFPAAGGDIEITPINHASVQVEYAGKVIQVDPWRQGDYSQAKPADLIVVTGAENDHLDPEAIAKIRKPGAPIVIPAAGNAKAPDGVVLANGETKTVAGISIEAVAAYDLIPGDPFHPKGRGNSYIITLGGQRLYFSGVGECVPEVQALKGIDIAFLSMNLPHGRMTPAAAAECVTIFKPRVVYPYHYRDGKVEDFKDDLKGEPVDVRLAKWYPSATGK
ncbi:MAG: MBL fold metallo-hydrolase [Bryobacteraceae bacterium]|jgi:L-ascorbate metabolism protein UlaG (beta-lactamase superfamily)